MEDGEYDESDNDEYGYEYEDDDGNADDYDDWRVDMVDRYKAEEEEPHVPASQDVLARETHASLDRLQSIEHTAMEPQSLGTNHLKRSTDIFGRMWAGAHCES